MDMNEEKTGLKIVLGILAVLAVLGALWRVLSYEEQHSSASTAPVQTVSVQGDLTVEDPLQELKTQELLGDTTTPVAVASAAPAVSQASMHVSPSSKMPYPQNRATPKQPYANYPGGGKPSQRYVDTNFYTPDNKPLAASPRNTSYASTVTGPSVSFNTSASAKVQEERARMLAPYLRPNRKEKERMDAQWNKIAAAIERAVAQALMPKSKKEAMIEKYSAAQGTAQAVQNSGFTGPFAAVGQQIASQKQTIVQSMGSAFGSSAAQEAASLMDSYAGEVANALNTPGLTAEQATKEVKEISKKYQEKMDKMAEKNQYDKFTADRIAQDNQQKEALRAAYQDPDLNIKFGQIIDAGREKELSLATQNLPPNEYYQAVYANQYDMHHQLEEAVRQAGQPLDALHQLEQKQAQSDLEVLKQKEEAGQIQSVAREYTTAEKAGVSTHLEKEQKDMLDTLTKAYGPENRADFEQLLQTYQQQVMQAAAQELSPAEHQAREMQLANEFNRQLIDLRIEKIQQMNIPDEQKQAAIEKLRQNYNQIPQ